ncbi:hypothetical protein E2542_SST09470 [Spatholobus suberectus]|nr:hypothetical protein E2542_SST09470 [Spatholobus suberectus]
MYAPRCCRATPEWVSPTKSTVMTDSASAISPSHKIKPVRSPSVRYRDVSKSESGTTDPLKISCYQRIIQFSPLTTNIQNGNGAWKICSKG